MSGAVFNLQDGEPMGRFKGDNPAVFTGIRFFFWGGDKSEIETMTAMTNYYKYNERTVGRTDNLHGSCRAKTMFVLRWQLFHGLDSWGIRPSG